MMLIRSSLALAAIAGALAVSGQVPVQAEGPRPVTVVAVGDIAESDGQQAATAALTGRLAPERVLLLGDLAYTRGSSQQFRDHFLPAWGRFAPISWAVPGNHEHYTADAAGYRAVAKRFGWPQQAGSDYWWEAEIPGSGWAVIGLDSEVVAGPAATRQAKFLRAALAKHDGKPLIVLWHRPRFSRGQHGDAPDVGRYWRQVVADADVRLVLWAHEHDYERRSFARPAPAPALDTFIVGTGGAELRQCRVKSRGRWLLCGPDNFGVLKLTLRPNGFSWAFVHTDDAVADSGTRSFG